MRIAIVSREITPYFGAGIGTYAAAAARAWRTQGHEVHLLSEDHRGFAVLGPTELAGSACHPVPPLPAPYFFIRHALGIHTTLRRLHAQLPFDYIEFPDYFAEGYFAIRAKRTRSEFPGAVLGVRLHSPTHECRAINNEGPGNEEIAALQACEEAAIRGADVVVSPTRSLLAMVDKRLKLLSPAFVVPYPFRLGESESAVAPAPIDRPTILFYGRLERRKGVELLLEAGKHLLDLDPRLYLRFIGGDTLTGPNATSMLAHLRAQVPDALRDRITFEARRPRAELFALIKGVAAAGGLCCFPSIWENFPNVCLEAMSLGAPVVGSDAGGMAEIIEDNTSGVLFRSCDVHALQSALERVLSDAALRSTLTRHAPARIRDLCDPNTVINQMIDAITSARNSPDFNRARPFDDVPLPSAPISARLKAAAKRWLAK